MTPALPSPFTPIIQMVLDSVTSPQSKRAYSKALSDFMAWYQDTKPEGGFCKATVQEYRALLVDGSNAIVQGGRGFRSEKLAAASINLRLTAIRKLSFGSICPAEMGRCATGRGHCPGP